MGFTRSFLRVLALGALGSCLALVIARADVAVRRFAENPLVSVRSDPSVGDNVNGPSVIKVPSCGVRLPRSRLRSTAYHMVDASLGPWMRSQGRGGSPSASAMPSAISWRCVET